MTASQSALESVVTSPVARSFFTSRPSRMIPALFTSALSPPIASGRPGDERPHVVLARHVEPAAVDARGQLGEARLVHVARRDLRAGLGEPAGEVGAHPLGAAGDDDLQVGELHGVLLSRSAADGSPGGAPTARSRLGRHGHPFVDAFGFTMSNPAACSHSLLTPSGVRRRFRA